MASNDLKQKKPVTRARRGRSRFSMSEAIRKMRIRTFVIMIVEIVLVGAEVMMYFYDFPKGFNNWMRPEYWIYNVAFVLVFNILFLWFSELHISTIRQKSELDASAIIGSDVQEAYNFGELGLVIIDDNDSVMWASPLFKDRQIDLLDSNIFEWQPTLKELIGNNIPADMTVDIEANSRFYNVKYLPDAHLFIFRDISDYQQVYNYNKEQGLVIGVTMIDNYEDITGKTENDNNDLMTKVRTALMDYAKTYGVLLRRFRSDSYFIILEKVRNIDSGTNARPTLSIGIAHDFPDANKLNEMASNAIDIAMSRGGDQVVVSKYGEDLKFYGGKSAAIEQTGRVQFRSVADSIRGLIESSSNVIVSGHKDADMDALGACIGILALCNHVKKPCQIVFDPKMTEKKTRLAFQSSFAKSELDRITITPKDAEDRIKPTTLFIVVDVSVPAMVMGQRALEKAAKTVVIDHHRRGEAFIDRPVLSYIDPSASSTSEILAEFIHYITANPRVELPPNYATIMLAGIFLDTGFFKSKSTGVRTFEAAEILKEYGGDNAKADDFLKDDFDEYRLVTGIISTVRTPYTGIVYCVSEESDIVENATLAKVANQIMRLKDIHACFVVGRVEQNATKISARSDGSINVQLLCEKMGGGGHFEMAAAAFTGATVESTEKKLLETLDLYLEEAKSDLGGH